MAERIVGTGSFGVVYQVFIFDLQYFFTCNGWTIASVFSVFVKLHFCLSTLPWIYCRPSALKLVKQLL